MGSVPRNFSGVGHPPPRKAMGDFSLRGLKGGESSARLQSGAQPTRTANRSEQKPQPTHHSPSPRILRSYGECPSQLNPSELYAKLG